MRAIDGEVLEQILQNAITLQKEMAKNLDIEDDPEVQMEIKAYTDILQGVKEQPTIEPERNCVNFEEQIHSMFDHIWDCEIDHPMFQDTVGELMSAVIQAYNNSRQPERKTGKWIDEGQYAEGHSEHAYRCSECEEHYIGWVGEFKFCPNCGSYMGGDES